MIPGLGRHLGISFFYLYGYGTIDNEKGALNHFRTPLFKTYVTMKKYKSQL